VWNNVAQILKFTGGGSIEFLMEIMDYLMVGISAHETNPV
jgi:hypothetical protein